MSAAEELSALDRAALAAIAEEEGDYGLLMLGDVRRVFEDEARPAFLLTARILEALHERDERPWPDYRSRGPIKATEVSRLLGRFGVKPGSQRIGPKVLRGYRYSDLAGVWERYLPQPQEVAVTAPAEEGAAVAGVAGDRAGCGAPTSDDRGEAWEPDETQLDALEF